MKKSNEKVNENLLVVPVLVESVLDLFFVIPNSASVSTNHFSLFLKFETFKIREDGLHFNIIFMNVEAGFESNDGDLWIIAILTKITIA